MTTIRPPMSFGEKCWLTRVQHMYKMRALKLDKIRNKHIHKNLGILPIGDKLRETLLMWFGHVQCRKTTIVREFFHAN